MNTTRGATVLLLAATLVMASAGTGGAQSKLSPESKKFHDIAGLIMTRSEAKIWKRLPDEASRKEFIDDFWAKRDPDPDSGVNEFQVEFEGRVAYANKRFRGEGGPGMNTDRGRIHIFMGPPDKIDEYATHGDATVRGPIIWWIYYDYHLGIEFVDEKNNGKFVLRKYEGDFFEAMDILKLGTYVGTKDVFLKRVVNFDLTYVQAEGVLEVALPAKLLNFKENDAGKFQIDLRFKFYIYEGKDLGRKVLEEQRAFEATNLELEGLKTVPFRFAYRLKPGTNYVDVIIQGKEGTNTKVRKLFEVKGGA